MIFVTVGTHEQPFDRLLQYMDDWKEKENISEDIVMQTGFSTYEPKNCSWKKLYSYQEMNALVRQARIVITHGGPSSFIMALQIGKVPVVIPRRKEFGEHVNDHQVEFCRFMADRQDNIIVVEDMERLGGVLQEYDHIVRSVQGGLRSNNEKFCEEFEKIVNELTGVE